MKDIDIRPISYILAILSAIASTAIAGPNSKLQFFGGVTDPSLYPGQYPFSWPDTLFTRAPYNQAVCQDSASEYQIQSGVNEFDGPTHLGWKPLDEFYYWTRAHHFTFNWYGGFMAATTDKWGDSRFSGPTWVQAFTNWVATAASRYPDIEYITVANEVLHVNVSNSGFAQAFGGTGTTGWDWVVNVAKLFRQYFPQAKLGINDFQVESASNDLPYGSSGRTNLPAYLQLIRVLKEAGLIDWVGLQSYSLETVSSSNFASALNQLGALGVSIILTEFSPDAYAGAGVDPNKVLTDWQRLLPLAINNRYVIGVTGPWTFRKSNNGSVPGSQWIVDDTVNPSSNTGTDSPTMTWLKGYIPGVLE
jgi:endo-1,4-beta-xylanase